MVEARPGYSGWFSVGVGRAMPKQRKYFGLADGTCGLWQHAANEHNRHARTKGFGRRADRDDAKLGPPIVEGSRLALHLSPRGAEGTRTLRFFAGGLEVAVFVLVWLVCVVVGLVVAGGWLFLFGFVCVTVCV